MNSSRARTRLSTFLAATVVAVFPLTGCIVVGGSSRGGFFFWPGSFGLVFLVLLYIFFFRGRR